MGNIKLTLLIVTRDHENFIESCLHSVNREFGEDQPIFLVDTGSFDQTFEVGKRFLELNNSNFNCIKLIRGTSTLQMLKVMSDLIDSDFLIGISGDDQFGTDYAFGANYFLAKHGTGDCVGFFNQVRVDTATADEYLKRTTWSKNKFINIFRLSYSNPGISTGVILPWNVMNTKKVFQAIPKILIEDYWLWWQLVHDFKFVNIPIGTTIYRIHGSNISLKSQNLEYAYSLGYCVGLPLSKLGSRIFLFTNLLLLGRWIRHINWRGFSHFFKGWLDGVRGAPSH